MATDDLILLDIQTGDVDFTDLGLGQIHSLNANNLKFQFAMGTYPFSYVIDLDDIRDLSTRSPTIGNVEITVTNIVEQPKSVITKTHLPQFFDFEESKLVEFMKYYYEWMENIGPDYYSRNIISYNDIDSKKSGYATFDEFLKNEFLKDFPTKMEIDQRFLIKHIKDFYRAKGSEDALRLLFRILFNDEIEISYPGEKMLRASHGKWFIETSMKVTLLVDSIIGISDFDFLDGTQSKATAKIQRVEQTINDDSIEIEIFFDSKNGEFVIDEIVNSRLTGKPLAVIKELITYPGKWLNTDGWLSSDMKLQDNYYYQEFSYVIKSGYPSEVYRDAVYSLAHPAGTVFFSEYLLSVIIDNELNYDEMVRFYTKQVIYEINYYEFMKLSTEYDTSEGQSTGKYILTYEFVADDIAIDHPYTFVYESLTNTGQVFDGFTLHSSGNFNTINDNDTIEIIDDVNKTTHYSKVKSKISNNEVILYNEYPYDHNINVKFNRYDNDNISKAETIIYVNNETEVFDDLLIIDDLMSYDINQNLFYEDIKNIYYDRLDNKVFGKTANTNMKTLPVVPKTSIISISNDINSNNKNDYIKQVYTPNLFEIEDDYLLSPNTSLKFKITNI